MSRGRCCPKHWCSARVALAFSRVLYYFCSLRESLTASAQLCDCDQEPNLPIWASTLGFPPCKLANYPINLLYWERFCGHHGLSCKGDKNQQITMGFAAQSQFCSAGSAAQGAADCWEMGKAASSPKRQHSHPRQFSVSLKLVHTGFEGRISKWHFGLQ